MEIKQLADELALHNSQVALKSLFLHFYPKLLLFISYYVKSRQEAEEIVSDIFLSVWERREQLLSVRNFRAYLNTIARNMAVSHVRKKSNLYGDVFISEEIEYTISVYSNPETNLIESELMYDLDVAVESLPDKCRQAFRLVREHGMKYREAAEILEISEKTLEAHMALAIKRIREKLRIRK